jgi:hypothetical protein
VVTEVSLIIQSLYRRCASGDLGKAREIIASLEKMPSMNHINLNLSQEKQLLFISNLEILKTTSN